MDLGSLKKLAQGVCRGSVALSLCCQGMLSGFVRVYGVSNGVKLPGEPSIMT